MLFRNVLLFAALLVLLVSCALGAEATRADFVQSSVQTNRTEQAMHFVLLAEKSEDKKTAKIEDALADGAVHIDESRPAVQAGDFRIPNIVVSFNMLQYVLLFKNIT